MHILRDPKVSKYIKKVNNVYSAENRFTFVRNEIHGLIKEETTNLANSSFFTLHKIRQICIQFFEIYSFTHSNILLCLVWLPGIESLNI